MESRNWIVVFGLCAAFCSGIYLQSRLESEPEQIASLEAAGSSNQVAPGTVSLLTAFDASANSSVSYDPTAIDQPFPDLAANPVHADAVDVPVPVPVSKPQPIATAPPATLPPVPRAQPIERASSSAEQELQSALDAALAQLPQAQQEVWREVLKGLSPAEAIDIVEIWKTTGGPVPFPGNPLGLEGLPTIPRQPATTIPRFPGHSAPQPPDNVEWQVTIPGYRRSERVGHSAGMGADRLNLTPGELQTTHNPLHVAIEGAGFFMLQHDSTTACTRNGEFDLSPDGELVQYRPDGLWFLQPRVKVPLDAARIEITSSGEVLAHFADPEARQGVACGHVELVTVLNPQHLRRLDADLLQSCERSGPLVTIGPRGPLSWTLHQGALESSNALPTSTSAPLMVEKPMPQPHKHSRTATVIVE